MATTVTRSIGTASRYYSTIQAWEDDIPADLVTADQVWVGECYNDSEFAGTEMTFSAHTSDATRYWHLTAAAGQSFRDHASVRTNALTYDQSKGVGISNGGGYRTLITFGTAQPYFRLTRLQFKTVSGTSGTIGGTNGCTGFLVSDCVISTGMHHAWTNTCGDLGGAGGRYQNVLVINTNAGGLGHGIGARDGTTFHACTSVRPSNITPAGGDTGFLLMGYSTVTLISCASFGFSSCANVPGATSAWGSGCKNNAANNTSGLPGSSNQHSVTYTTTTPFVSSGSSGLDLRAAGGNALDANGYLDATNAPTDISGYTRALSPTIGAWETVSTPPAAQDSTSTVAPSTWVTPAATALIPEADDLLLRSQLGVGFFWMRGGLITPEDLSAPESLDFLLGLYAQQFGGGPPAQDATSTAASATWATLAATAAPAPVTASSTVAVAAWLTRAATAAPGAVSATSTVAIATWATLPPTATPGAAPSASTPAVATWATVAALATSGPGNAASSAASLTWGTLAATATAGPVSASATAAVASWGTVGATAVAPGATVSTAAVAAWTTRDATALPGPAPASSTPAVATWTTVAMVAAPAPSLATSTVAVATWGTLPGLATAAAGEAVSTAALATWQTRPASATGGAAVVSSVAVSLTWVAPPALASPAAIAATSTAAVATWGTHPAVAVPAPATALSTAPRAVWGTVPAFATLPLPQLATSVAVEVPWVTLTALATADPLPVCVNGAFAIDSDLEPSGRGRDRQPCRSC